MASSCRVHSKGSPVSARNLNQCMSNVCYTVFVLSISGRRRPGSRLTGVIRDSPTWSFPIDAATAPLTNTESRPRSTGYLSLSTSIESSTLSPSSSLSSWAENTSVLKRDDPGPGR